VLEELGVDRSLLLVRVRVGVRVRVRVKVRVRGRGRGRGRVRVGVKVTVTVTVRVGKLLQHSSRLLDQRLTRLRPVARRPEPASDG
jgi:hypothetical protein